MGLKIYGIGLAQNTDRAGETILLDGVDDSGLVGIRDEHDDNSMFRRVGAITYTKKIYTEADCENEKQRRCWKHAGVPFLYAEGELADDAGHPNAISAAALLKFSQRPDINVKVGWSVDGDIFERQNSSGKPTEDPREGRVLSKTRAVDLAITVQPCNPKCAIFLENDLAKSFYSEPVPEFVQQALKKSAAAERSFTEVTPLGRAKILSVRVADLKKSIDDYHKAFTGIKCHKCSNPVRFFKSTQDMPNACLKCGSQFSLDQLWKALNA